MIFKHLSAIMLSLAMIVSLAACGNSTETNGASSTLPDSTPATQSENTSAAESASETEPDVTSTEEDEEGNASSEPEAGSNILVAYFSLAGELYQVGVIEEGNTSIIAHLCNLDYVMFGVLGVPLYRRHTCFANGDYCDFSLKSGVQPLPYWPPVFTQGKGYQ